MTPKQQLLKIYNQVSTDSTLSISPKVDSYLKIVSQSIESQKGVYTVILTLAVYKSLFPNQDIRLHQDNMTGGFSGRSIDTRHITPTLKELGLTSMSESGWLTRSLEQPYPYDLNYNGKVGKPEVKEAFLKIVDFIQNNYEKSEKVAEYLLTEAVKIRSNNKVEINPIENPDLITIEKTIAILSDYFHSNFATSGGSKLPVICFYSIYSILVKELKRYDGCELKELGSHTTCDKTSKSSGDIEIYSNGVLLESLEIKYGIEIDSHIVNRAVEKIHTYNPKRYYILSTAGIKKVDESEINNKVIDLKENHGCQLIINGLLQTLKYYLRLINDLNEFIQIFSENILNDTELKITHKQVWADSIKKFNT